MTVGASNAGLSTNDLVGENDVFVVPARRKPKWLVLVMWLSSGSKVP